MSGPMFHTSKPRCPFCQTVADDFTPVDDNAPEPEEGSVSLCIYCLGVSIFTGEGLEKRKPTREELVEIMADPQVVAAIRVLEAWPDRPSPISKQFDK